MSAVGDASRGDPISSRELVPVSIRVKVGATGQGHEIKVILLDQLKRLAQSGLQQAKREGNSTDEAHFEGMVGKIDDFYTAAKAQAGGKALNVSSFASSSRSASTILSGQSGLGDTATRVEGSAMKSLEPLFSDLRRFALDNLTFPLLEPSDVHTELDRVSSENIDLRSRSVALETDLTLRGVEVEGLLGKVHSLQGEKRELLGELREAKDLFAREEARLTETIQERDYTIGDLRGEIQGLEEDLGDLREELTKLQKQSEKDERAIENLRDGIKEKAAEIRDLKSNVEGLTSERDNLLDEVAQLKRDHVAKVEGLGRQIEGLNADVRSKDQKIGSLEGGIAKLRGQNVMLRMQLMGSRSSLKEAKAENTELKAENAGLTRDLERAQGDLSDFGQHYRNVSRELATTKEQLAEKTAMVQSQSEELGVQSAVVHGLEAEVQSLKESVESLGNEKNRLRETIGIKEREIESLQGQVSDLTELLRVANDRIPELEEAHRSELSARDTSHADALAARNASHADALAAREASHVDALSVQSRAHLAATEVQHERIERLEEDLATAQGRSQAEVAIEKTVAEGITTKYNLLSDLRENADMGTSYALFKRTPIFKRIALAGGHQELTRIWEEITKKPPDHTLLRNMGLGALHTRDPNKAELVFMKAGLEAVKIHAVRSAVEDIDAFKLYEDHVARIVNYHTGSSTKSKIYTAAMISAMKAAIISKIDENCSDITIEQKLPKANQIAEDPTYAAQENYGGISGWMASATSDKQGYKKASQRKKPEAHEVKFLERIGLKALGTGLDRPIITAGFSTDTYTTDAGTITHFQAAHAAALANIYYKIDAVEDYSDSSNLKVTPRMARRLAALPAIAALPPAPPE